MGIITLKPHRLQATSQKLENSLLYVLCIWKDFKYLRRDNQIGEITLMKSSVYLLIKKCFLTIFSCVNILFFALTHAHMNRGPQNSFSFFAKIPCSGLFTIISFAHSGLESSSTELLLNARLHWFLETFNAVVILAFWWNKWEGMGYPSVSSNWVLGPILGTHRKVTRQRQMPMRTEWWCTGGLCQEPWDETSC